jgi:hypothetical protein
MQLMFAQKSEEHEMLAEAWWDATLVTAKLNIFKEP